MKTISDRACAALRRCVVPLLLFACLQTARAGQNWIFDFRSGILYDSNVSHSDRSHDVEQDEAWRTSLSAGQGFQLTDDLRLSAFAELQSEVWRTYDGLSNIEPALETNLRYRFGLGRNAPWIRLDTKFAYADFSEARRSGWQILPALHAGVSLSERLRIEAAYDFEHFAARDAVFAQDAHRVSLHGKIDITSSTQMVIGYAYRHGDVTSSAIPPRPDLVRVAEVQEPINTFDEEYMAYRFEASTHIASIAISQALTNFAAVRASYEWQYTTHGALCYTNHISEVAIAFSF